MFRRATFVLACMLLAISSNAAITTVDSSQLSAEQVAALLAGPGATVSNVHITGSPSSIGSFTSAQSVFEIPSGMILSTGKIADVAGPNNSPSNGSSMSTPGDAQLSALVPPYETHDAIVLEFDVVTDTPTLSIRYVFASEEYLEFVNSSFNDVFAFWVNGTNIALAPGGLPVAINTINHLKNATLFRDNHLGGMNTQFDGYTRPMEATAVVTPGSPVHIKIALADTSDSILDSAVLIAQGGVSGGIKYPVITADPQHVVAGIGEEVSADVTLSYVDLADHLALDTPDAPGGVTTKFTAPVRWEDNSIHSTMTLKVGPETALSSYVVPIRLVRNEKEEFFGSFYLELDCNPPLILGIDQPKTVSVTRGERATLHVGNVGSPGSYQWYNGYSGFTWTPIEGATGAEFITPPVTGFEQYWVRVTNACGTADSMTAFVIPQD